MFMILSLLVWIPILGAIVLAFFPKEGTANQWRLLSLVIAGLILALNLVLGLQFEVNNPQMQFVESFSWISGIGLSYHLGVDGLSFPLLCLNSLLTLIAMSLMERSI